MPEVQSKRASKKDGKEALLIRQQVCESMGSYDVDARINARVAKGWFVTHMVAVGGLVHVVFERTDGEACAMLVVVEGTPSTCVRIKGHDGAHTDERGRVIWPGAKEP